MGSGKSWSEQRGEPPSGRMQKSVQREKRVLDRTFRDPDVWLEEGE